MNERCLLIVMILFIHVSGNKYLDEYEDNEYDFGVNDEDYHPMTRSTMEYVFIYTDRYSEHWVSEEISTERVERPGDQWPTEPREQLTRAPVVRKYIHSLYDEYECTSRGNTTISLHCLMLLIHCLTLIVLYLK